MRNDDFEEEEQSGRALLSDEEISALMTPKKDASGSAAQEKRQRVVPYDFRRPDRVSKEQVRSLYLLYDAFARNLSSSLPTFLRAVSEVTLISVEQRAYMDYLSGLPDPAAIFKLEMKPLQGMAVLEISPNVAFPLIDRQLGGPGVTLNEMRAMTEIEQKVLEGFLKIVNDALRSAWQPILEIDFKCVGCETAPKLLQIVPPNEVVLSIIFHIQVVDARGTLSLCIPALYLEPILQKLNESSYSRMHPDAPPDQTRAIIDKLAQVPFPITADLRPTSAPISDLIRLAPGDVMRLDHRVGDPVDVCVGELLKFRGDLASKDLRTAVCIRTLES